MAVSTIGSLGEIFTAGVPLQMEEPAPVDEPKEGEKDKSGSPLAPINEDADDGGEGDGEGEEDEG